MEQVDEGTRGRGDKGTEGTRVKGTSEQVDQGQDQGSLGDRV